MKITTTQIKEFLKIVREDINKQSTPFDKMEVIIKYIKNSKYLIDTITPEIILDYIKVTDYSYLTSASLEEINNNLELFKFKERNEEIIKLNPSKKLSKMLESVSNRNKQVTLISLNEIKIINDNIINKKLMKVFNSIAKYFKIPQVNIKNINETIISDKLKNLIKYLIGVEKTDLAVVKVHKIDTQEPITIFLIFNLNIKNNYYLNDYIPKEVKNSKAIKELGNIKLDFKEIYTIITFNSSSNAHNYTFHSSKFKSIPHQYITRNYNNVGVAKLFSSFCSGPHVNRIFTNLTKRNYIKDNKTNLNIIKDIEESILSPHVVNMGDELGAHIWHFVHYDNDTWSYCHKLLDTFLHHSISNYRAFWGTSAPEEMGFERTDFEADDHEIHIGDLRYEDLRYEN